MLFTESTKLIACKVVMDPLYPTVFFALSFFVGWAWLHCGTTLRWLRAVVITFLLPEYPY